MRTRRELFTLFFDHLKEPPEPPVPRGPLPLPARPGPSDDLPAYQRPPGALAEEDFVRTCERCKKCAEACPHDVIVALGTAYGDKRGTPVVLPRVAPCRLCEDLPCAAACPSGALRVVPLAEVRMGTARLDPDRCLAVRGQACDDCLKECPLGDRALRMYGGVPTVIEAGCTGCGICVYVCPTTPKAMTVVAAL